MLNRDQRVSVLDRVARTVTPLCLFLALAVPSSIAQTASGTIKGTVTDNQGAVVSGASVAVTNVGTGRAVTVTTAGDGSYVVPVLPPGSYRVDVQQTGFKVVSQTITLQTQQVAVLNFALAVGQVTETLEVTGDAPVVDTSTSSTGEVIQGRQVTELPLNGRNFTQLALLTPGVTRGVSGDNASGGTSQTASETFRNSETGGAALSVNGLRPQANNYLLDGVDNNDSLVNTIIFFPPAEAIQEFRVNTSVAPAEFGRAGGAIVETSIKSGSNEFHGAAFEFLRNSFFDARPTNLQVENPKQASFKRNQFGFTLGGPILKNKLFFFLDYQGLRQDQPLPAELATVPTDKMRQGDFSELLGTTLPSVPGCALSNPAFYTGSPTAPVSKGFIFDPRTCTPFGWNGTTATNLIPTTIANQAGLNYLNAYPQPNLPGTILQNYQAVRHSIRNFDDFDGRLDYNLTSRDILFGRYSYGQDKFTVTPRLPTLPSGFGSGLNYNDPRSVAAGYTHTFTANLLNDFRFAYVRDKYGYFPPFGNIPLSANLGIVNANRTPLLGGGALIGGNNNEIEYTGDGGPYTVPQKTYQFLDSVSLIRGAHALKFGANIIRRELDFFQGNNAKGYFIIGGVNYPGTGRFTGYEVSELLAGFSDYELGSSQNLYQTLNWETGYYAQDDWRATRRLTLNLGLRYDLYTHPYERHNQQSNYDFASGTLLVAGVNGNSRSLVDTDFHNFGPRLGFAYDVFGTGKTSLRGGFGIFYFLDRGGVANQLSNNPDFNGISTYTAANGYRITLSGQGPLGNNDWTLATSPLPLPAVTVDPNHPQNVSVISIPRNNKTSNVREWNLQLEQELTQNMSLNVGYVGSQMNNLMTYYNANNQPLNSTTKLNPALGGSITTGIADGTGYYNGLQTRLNQRFRQGLQFTASYTWSHTTDNSNGAFSVQCSGGSGCGRIFVAPGTGAPLLSLNRGNADNDIRHFFVFSSLYELPFGRGRRFMGNASRALDLIAGGWQFNSILTMTTGTSLDINMNGTVSNRPDLVGPVVINGPNHQWINRTAFLLPATDPRCTASVGSLCTTVPLNSGQWTRAGYLGRNAYYGPGTHTVDLSLFKDFTITERVKTQFRAEAFNAFNSPQWANPDTNLSDGTFGQITGPRLNTERQLQFALRVTF